MPKLSENESHDESTPFPKSGLMMLTMLMKNPESPSGERAMGTFPFLGQHHQHHQPQPVVLTPK